MRVDVSMNPLKQEFHVSSWWAGEPDFLIKALQSQLEAASAIWPELKNYSIAKRPGQRGGKVGGDARAAALSPERRSEIAKEAANKRWGKSPNLTHDSAI